MRDVDTYLRVEIEHRRDVANESAEAHEGSADESYWNQERDFWFAIDALLRDSARLEDLLDAALTGLREPMTLADARRVRDTLTHEAVARSKARATAARNDASRVAPALAVDKEPQAPTSRSIPTAPVRTPPVLR